MEMYIGLAVAFFVIVIVALLASAFFGMQQKTYEQVVAEKRQATSELLGSQHAANVKHAKSNKDKKLQKKASAKKSKERAAAAAAAVNSESEETTPPSSPPEESAPAPTKTHHVEFKEAPQTITETSAVCAKEQLKSKPNKKLDTVRPILVHRRDSGAAGGHGKSPQRNSVPLVDASETIATVTNHFDITHPKDDLELAHVHQKEDIKHKHKAELISEAKVEKKSVKSVQTTPDNISKSTTTVDLPAPHAKDAATQNNEAFETAKPAASAAPGGSSKKKKKAEFGSGDGKQTAQAATLATIMPLVRNAELSRSDVQLFIDMLLNKQLEAPSTLDEWSEAKNDPLQRLKKQLVERDNQLAESKEQQTALQNRLIKLRDEMNVERSHVTSRTRNLEEQLQAKSLEIQNNVRQHNQQLQQLQAQVADARKVCDDHISLQNQCKQYEMRVSQLLDGETQLKNLLAEQNDRNSQLSSETHALKDELMKLMNNINASQQESEQKTSLIRELEGAHVSLEHTYKTEVAQLNTVLKSQHEKIRELEFISQQALMELQKQCDENLAKMAMELQAAQEECTVHRSTIVNLNASQAQAQNSRTSQVAQHQIEVRNQQNELSSLRAQIQQLNARHQADLDNLQAQLKEQREKNDELRVRSWKVIDALNVAENRCKELTKQHSSMNDKEQNNTENIEEQAKKRCQEFVGKLFPDVNIANYTSSLDDWLACARSSIETELKKQPAPAAIVIPAISPPPVIADGPSPNEKKLQAKVHMLQQAIRESEVVLKKIESRVQEEEIHWRKQLRAKDMEIAQLQSETTMHAIRSDSEHSFSTVSTPSPRIAQTISIFQSNTIADELQIQVSELQLELSAEQEAHRRSLEKLSSLLNNSSHSQHDIRDLQSVKMKLNGVLSEHADD